LGHFVPPAKVKPRFSEEKQGIKERALTKKAVLKG